MSFRHLIRYGLSLPPHIAFSKALRMAKKNLLGKWRGHAGEHQTTYEDIGPEPFTALTNIDSPLNINQISYDLAALCKKYMAHEFNLLGSGWTHVAPPPDRGGISVSSGNAVRAGQIRDHISEIYTPIDWQLDFISGYRWSELTRSEAIAYGHEPGVDIKVPWELARLQHLVQLALAYGAATKGGDGYSEPQAYLQEFQNQTLDFMASNPPGYGVNWACTMDVAIRAANLILAFDLLRAQSATFSPDFTPEFIAAIQAHGTHITNNLEWHTGFRGNHYLADITGLLFVASFLPRDPKTDSWLALGVQEFINEIDIQFHSDGGNAEASTNYHRLSAEMAIYGTALILGLSADKKAALETYDADSWRGHPRLRPAPIKGIENAGPFSKRHFEQLQKMAYFTIDVTKPDGHVIQIGDTDNGRLFKLCPALEDGALEEDHQDHHHLIAAAGGLFGKTEWLDQAGKAYQTEAEFIRRLKGKSTPPTAARPSTPQSLASPAPINTGALLKSKRLIIELPSSDLRDGLTAIAYPDFGLYIWRSDHLFLSLRCGPIGQAGNGGHAHNDQLALDLQIDGVDWVADPGTVTYTADTKTRDRYRSHLAHSGPRFEASEPARLDLGLFRLEDSAKAHCLVFNAREFQGVHFGYQSPTFRSVRFDEGQIEITDSYGAPVAPEQTPETVRVKTAEDLRTYFGLTLAYSPGYGHTNDQTHP